MLDFNLCPHAIKKCCESINNVPEIWGEMYGFVMEIIECWDMWSFDKNTTQIESMLLAILTNYTSDRFHYNWFSSQYVITMEILEREGYNNEVMDYYEHYDDSDEDFNRFWETLQISHPNLDIEKINRESMAYHSKYSILHYKLKEFAEIRNIDFAKLAERAGWHKDFWGLSTNTTTNLCDIEAYIIKDRERVLRAIDAELVGCNKPQGKRIALIICALEQYGYITNIDGNIERIYNAFKQRYPDKIASRQSVSQYLNAHRNPNAYTDKPRFMDRELERFINTI